MTSTPVPSAAAETAEAPGKGRGSRDTRESVRTCVGCQAKFSAADVEEIESSKTPIADLHVRVVLGPTASKDERAEVAVDFAGSSFGRGAHVHVRPACIERACRGGFARSFKHPVAATPKSLAEQIILAAEQRIRGLLLGARRAKLVAFGEEAREAVATGKARLAIVAVDAGASGTKGALLGAVHDGRVVAYGTKADLGALFGREEVAVVAITHPGVAAQIHCARAAADAVSVLARPRG